MITAIIPKLPFIHKSKTIEFYEKLGFVLNSDYDDYCIISKDDLEIHLFAYQNLNPMKSDFMIYIRLEDKIDEFYKKLEEKNIEIHPNGKLEVKPWNQIEFSIIDPNGTLLTFGQSI
ncbi:bleomycin resistance protein [Flavobacterium terrae]|uniref:Glyoxalase/Bleomycin resistance protein/Dioxygenase superfamily protein n=1 Tax=Flavobacterium terrae TaxID=415425 RepID=A0A1M6AAY3_9FLAO|nr:VOC family protein [Flavobacterium terrae]SHI33619.1 Glyoxalase/Bleomycin resistance protein/Dioxygenase superfamily protein [Flavobacterium terrae]